MRRLQDFRLRAPLTLALTLLAFGTSTGFAQLVSDDSLMDLQSLAPCGDLWSTGGQHPLLIGQVGTFSAKVDLVRDLFEAETFHFNHSGVIVTDSYACNAQRALVQVTKDVDTAIGIKVIHGQRVLELHDNHPVSMTAEIVLPGDDLNASGYLWAGLIFPVSRVFGLLPLTSADGTLPSMDDLKSAFPGDIPVTYVPDMSGPESYLPRFEVTFDPGDSFALIVALVVSKPISAPVFDGSLPKPDVYVDEFLAEMNKSGAAIAAAGFRPVIMERSTLEK